jgi:uncharacterized OsmC-like protein
MSNANVKINGVNLRAVGILVEQIRANPAVAKTHWASHVRWAGAFRSESQSRNQPRVPSDEPAALGGDDTAPNPVEQLLGALGNCLAVGYAANATVAGIRIDSLELEVEGDIDLHTFLGLANGNAGFETIAVKVRLTSDAEPEALERLHAKVVGTSPVGHTLGRAVPLRIDLVP